MSNEKELEPLRSAIEQWNAPLVKKLLQTNGNINAKDKNGNTPLLLAAQKSYSNMVEELLKNKAEADITNAAGCTALHYAIERKLESMARLLIDIGASLSIYVPSYGTAWQMAQRNACIKSYIHTLYPMLPTNAVSTT